MKFAIAIVCALAVSLPVLAETVQVDVFGVVEYNQIHSGDFAVVVAGDPVVFSFTVDSNNYVDSGTYPTRGYIADASSFSLTIGTVMTGLEAPFPAGDTPYFVLRNNDPAVDGFFLSATNVDFPDAWPLNIPGQIAPFFALNYQVGYSGDTLSSLDILAAVGTYDYTGIQSFYCTINDGFAEAMGWDYDHMVISTTVPTQTTTWGGMKALFQ
jgi:hypothetical protein